MTKRWYVTVTVENTLEVEADTQEEAEELALDRFDPTAANSPEVYESFEVDEEGWEK